VLSFNSLAGILKDKYEERAKQYKEFSDLNKLGAPDEAIHGIFPALPEPAGAFDLTSELKRQRLLSGGRLDGNALSAFFEKVKQEYSEGAAGKKGGNGESFTDNIPEKGKLPQEKEKITRVLGGAYKEVPADGGHVHHVPPKSVSTYSKYKSPALRMEAKDHVKTSSYGFSERSRLYRQKQRELIDKDRFLEAQQMNIDDIRLIFGDKYDEGVKQMQEYIKKLLNIE
jgi:hypothetical protein